MTTKIHEIHGINQCLKRTDLLQAEAAGMTSDSVDIHRLSADLHDNTKHIAD